MSVNQMRLQGMPVRRVLAAVVALALFVTLPAAASAAPAGKGKHPRAKSAGSDAAPLLPSIVRVRIDRGTASLARAADYVDRDMPDKAVASLLNARRNMYAAWRGAKYLIDHAPPAPVESGSVRRVRSGTVHMSGSGGAAAASVPETAGAGPRPPHHAPASPIP